MAQVLLLLEVLLLLLLLSFLVHVVGPWLRLRLWLGRGVETVRVGCLLLRSARTTISRSRQVIAKGIAVYSVAIAIAAVVVVATHTGHQCTVRGIVKIFGLLANTIMACVLQTTLNTALTRPLVA